LVGDWRLLIADWECRGAVAALCRQSTFLNHQSTANQQSKIAQSTLF
jgi:hypothetical protein